MAPPRKIDVEEAVRLRQLGVPVKDVALRFGVSHQAIRAATNDFMDTATIIPPRSPADGPVPETFTEMLELAEKDLWVYYKSAKGGAKLEAFKAIREMAKREQEDGLDGREPEPLIADVVAGVVSLSDERKRQILEPERARLLLEVEAIDQVLEVVAA